MDETQFKRIIIPLSTRMYAIAISVTCDREDARDVVQNTTIKLWEQRASLGKTSNPQAFALTTTRNAAIDFVRTRRRQQGIETIDCMCSGEDIEESMNRSQQVKRILSIIADLPVTQREIITMRDVQGYEFKEIEQATGQSAVNVRTLLSRTRKNIRKHFLND